MIAQEEEDEEEAKPNEKSILVFRVPTWNNQGIDHHHHHHHYEPAQKALEIFFSKEN